MVNLTIRNISEELMNKLRKRAALERRSINSEILILLEKSVFGYTPEKMADQAAVDAQAVLWQKLSGQWDDPRTAEEIASELFLTRTKGREVNM
jgi:plasmid stability protein